MIIKKDFCLKFDGRPTSALPVSIGSHWPCKKDHGPSPFKAYTEEHAHPHGLPAAICHFPTGPAKKGLYK